MPLFNLGWQKLSLTLRQPFTISRGTKTKVTNVLVTLGDGNLTGYGEAAPNRRYNEDAQSVITYLESIPAHFFDDIRNEDELATKLDEHNTTFVHPVQAARAALEMAWLDWWGKHNNKPLWKLWDAPDTTGPVTSFTIGLDEIPVMQQKVKEAAEYPLYKVKLGTDRDREIIEALRQETTKPIRVDANEGWETLQQAKQMIDFLEHQNIELIEQPMPADSREELKRLKAYSPIPLCADESFVGYESLRETAAAFDIINIKLMKIGSLVHARALIDKAHDYGLKVMIGCMIESSIANTAGALLSLWADFADLDGHLLITDDIARGIRLDDEKCVQMPNQPGLGFMMK